MSVKTAPNAKYTQSFARSAIAPQTIASDTPANTTSNRYPVAPGIPVKNEYGALPIESISFVDGKKPCVPTIPLPSPNAIANPNAQYTSEHTPKMRTFGFAIAFGDGNGIV